MQVNRDQQWLETLQLISSSKSITIDRLECLIEIRDGMIEEKDDEIILLKQEVARLRRMLVSATGIKKGWEFKEFK